MKFSFGENIVSTMTTNAYFFYWKDLSYCEGYSTENVKVVDWWPEVTIAGWGSVIGWLWVFVHCAWRCGSPRTFSSAHIPLSPTLRTRLLIWRLDSRLRAESVLFSGKPPGGIHPTVMNHLPAKHDNIVFNLFISRINHWYWERKDCLTNEFHPVEVVGRGSETQL